MIEARFSLHITAETDQDVDAVLHQLNEIGNNEPGVFGFVILEIGREAV